MVENLDTTMAVKLADVKVANLVVAKVLYWADNLVALRVVEMAELWVDWSVELSVE